MGSIRVLLWILIGLSLLFIVWRRYKKGQLMAVIWGLLAVGLTVYIGLGLMLFFGQSRMLYQPYRGYDFTPEDMGIAYEAVTLQTSDGQSIAGWYIPAQDEPTAWTVLFCHGNAGNISHRLDTIQLIHQLGLNSLIVDYRGYGESSGKPSEKGTLLDIKTAWNWLVNDKHKNPDSIILFGRSLGGSIAAIVAAEVHPAAAILESTFTSFVDIGKQYYSFMPVSLFARYDYNTLKAVKKLTCPVVVIHSPDDEIIPYRFGKEVFTAANEPKLFRDLKGGHNEGFYQNPQLYKQIWQDCIDYLKTSNESHDDSLNSTVP